MFNNKKGAELPMNTIIIAIVVVVVLIIVIVFFVGGTSTIAQKIRGIFGGATSGMDRQVAKNFCEGYCSAKDKHYCSSVFKIDTDPTQDIELKGFSCGPNSETGLTYKNSKGEIQDVGNNNLGVACDMDC